MHPQRPDADLGLTVGDEVPDPDAGHRLPCGASVDELLEQVADASVGQRTAHQAGCPHCAAALAEFADLWAPVHRLSRESVAVPPGITAAVMRHIDQLTADVWYTLHHLEGGTIRVATRVVAALARRAALSVAGVKVAFGRSSSPKVAAAAWASTHQHQHPHSAVGVLGRTAVIDLAVTVSYGQPIDAIAHQIQHRVSAELRTMVELQRVLVNVTVDDVIST